MTLKTLQYRMVEADALGVDNIIDHPTIFAGLTAGAAAWSMPIVRFGGSSSLHMDAGTYLTTGTMGAMTVSVWASTEIITGNPAIWGVGSDGHTPYSAARWTQNTSTRQFTHVLYGDDNTQVFSTTVTPGIEIVDGLVHYYCTYDSGSDQVVIYRNGVEIRDVAWNKTTNIQTLDGSGGAAHADDFTIGRERTGSATQWQGQIAEFWMDSQIWAASTYASQFYNGGLGADLGSDGSAITGSQPEVCMSGDATVWQAGTNKGKASDFNTIVTPSGITDV